MAEILGLPSGGARYVLELTDKERQAARDHLKSLGLPLTRAVVGIHTGGGGRWRLKQWEIASFTELMSQLRREFAGDVDILLFGGPLERECNARIAGSHGGVFDAGCDNEVRHFAALVEHCSVLVSGDSLAMHVGLAMGCRTVVLFGPTRHAEIELYGMGEKVIPDLDCLVCYKTDCDFAPNCMQSISVSMVRDAVARQLEHVTARR
jgi:heptosyltransferase-2